MTLGKRSLTSCQTCPEMRTGRMEEQTSGREIVLALAGVAVAEGV